MIGIKIIFVFIVNLFLFYRTGYCQESWTNDELIERWVGGFFFWFQIEYREKNRKLRKEIEMFKKQK